MEFQKLEFECMRRGTHVRQRESYILLRGMYAITCSLSIDVSTDASV